MGRLRPGLWIVLIAGCSGAEERASGGADAGSADADAGVAPASLPVGVAPVVSAVHAPSAAGTSTASKVAPQGAGRGELLPGLRLAKCIRQ